MILSPATPVAQHDTPHRPTTPASRAGVVRSALFLTIQLSGTTNIPLSHDPSYAERQAEFSPLRPQSPVGPTLAGYPRFAFRSNLGDIDRTREARYDCRWMKGGCCDNTT